jgi:hypothetical protein
LSNGRRTKTYPTFTHVPPSLLASTAIVLTPYMPLALLAQASPPLPPPMTKKSHSFTIGAMILVVLEKCRETETSLELVCAELEARMGAARERMVKAFMGGSTTRRGAVVDL